MGWFPDGWNFYSEAVNPATASIVIPASILSVRHVLSHLTATLLNNTAAYQEIGVQVLDGGVPILTATVEAFGNSEGSFDRDVVRYGSPATIMTIQFVIPAPVGMRQHLFVTGVDQ